MNIKDILAFWAPFLLMLLIFTYIKKEEKISEIRQENALYLQSIEYCLEQIHHPQYHPIDHFKQCMKEAATPY